MAIQKTEAMVLRTQPFCSTSLIVTFFSRNFGKLRGLVKGVRQENQTRGAVYELFAHLEILFYEKSRTDLHLVSEASILESYESLRSNLSSIAYASYFCDLVDQLSEVHDPHEKVFELLQFCLRYLPALSGEKLSRLFEIKLLNEIGWLPYLGNCLKCQDSTLQKGYFSARQGGLLCPRCARNFSDARPLSREALAAMRYLTRHDLEESVKFQTGPQATRELASLMNQFFLERLNRPLKSKLFLEKIKPALV